MGTHAAMLSQCSDPPLRALLENFGSDSNQFIIFVATGLPTGLICSAHGRASVNLAKSQPKPKEATMKKLNVTIKLELSVPDDWELVQTSEGGQVLKLPDNQFMDIAIEPLFASNPEETWASTEDDDVLNDILDMVESESVSYAFAKN
jgi:hypothetical protein